MEAGPDYAQFHLPWDTCTQEEALVGNREQGGLRMEGGRLLVRPGLGKETPSVSTYLPGNFLMPRSGLYPIKSLVRTQVIQKQTSNSSRASGFVSKSPWVFWVGCSNPGRIQGRPLTLSTNRPLPAFFADAGERVSVDHAGASIMTGVRQTATVSSYKTKAG